MVSSLDMLELVAQASPLFQRLDEYVLHKARAFPVDEVLLHERLAHWRQSAAQGEEEKFQHRLQWEGLDFDQIRSILGGVLPDEDQCLPKWAKTLQQLIDAAHDVR